MERQLKERLIGAAVLVAVAVIMVPEIFSGPHSHSEPAADSASASSSQVKTYHIELQSAQSTESAPITTVEAPAAQPRNEALLASYANASESSSSASSESMSFLPPQTVTESVAAVPKLAKPPTPAPEAPKAASNTKPADGDWAVQVGSFATQDKARQIVGKLKDQGYPAYLGTVTVAGKTLYRVRVGAMPERSAAEATLQKLKSSYPGASVVAANR